MLPVSPPPLRHAWLQAELDLIVRIGASDAEVDRWIAKLEPGDFLAIIVDPSTFIAPDMAFRGTDFMDPKPGVSEDQEARRLACGLVHAVGIQLGDADRADLIYPSWGRLVTRFPRLAAELPTFVRRVKAAANLLEEDSLRLVNRGSTGITVTVSPRMKAGPVPLRPHALDVLRLLAIQQDKPAGDMHLHGEGRSIVMQRALTNQTTVRQMLRDAVLDIVEAVHGLRGLVHVSSEWGLSVADAAAIGGIGKKQMKALAARIRTMPRPPSRPPVECIPEYRCLGLEPRLAIGTSVQAATYWLAFEPPGQLVMRGSDEAIPALLSAWIAVPRAVVLTEMERLELRGRIGDLGARALGLPPPAGALVLPEIERIQESNKRGRRDIEDEDEERADIAERRRKQDQRFSRK